MGGRHESEQFRVISQVDADLGDEREGLAMLLLPANNAVQELLGQLFIADEVVIDEKHHATPAGGQNIVQFDKELFQSLVAWLQPIEK